VAEAAEPQAPGRAQLAPERALEPAVSPLDEVRERVPEQPAQGRVPEPAEAPLPVRALPVVPPVQRAADPALDLRHRSPTAAR
jgi:hypothetical protein